MKRVIGAGAASVLLLSGCGGGPDPDCVEVGRDVAQGILDGANGSGLAIYPNTGGAIKSENDVWWVSFMADLDDGGDRVEATWLLGNIDPVEGPVMSVDAFASEWTDWPQMDGASGSEMHKRSKSCIRD